MGGFKIFMVAAGVAFIAQLASHGGHGATSFSGPAVPAQIESIEWACGYTETDTLKAGGRVLSSKSRQLDLDCSHEAAFIAIRNGDTSGKRMVGHATAVLRYVSPADHQAHEGWLKIDAADDTFYHLEKGQQIAVHVDPADPNKVSL